MCKTAKRLAAGRIDTLSSPWCSLVAKPWTDTLNNKSDPNPHWPPLVSLTTNGTEACVTIHPECSTNTQGSYTFYAITVTTVSWKSLALSWEVGPPQPDLLSLYTRGCVTIPFVNFVAHPASCSAITCTQIHDHNGICVIGSLTRVTINCVLSCPQRFFSTQKNVRWFMSMHNVTR